jgi:fused signal recognition particle receptor
MLRFRRRDSADAQPEGDEPALEDESGPTAVGDDPGPSDLTPPVLSDAVSGEHPGDLSEGAGMLEVLEDAPGDAPTELDRRSLRSRLGRTVALPFHPLRRRTRIDDELLDELEEALLGADVGLPTTTRLLDGLREAAKSKDAPEPIAVLRDLAVALFEGDDRELHLGDPPSVWLFVGVNGAGKTTTIGKLARREALAGRGVVVAAGDTFRAAAVEQLEIWAGRAGVAIVDGGEGADPASVVFDAKQHAAARNADLVLADTAGRLHTKANLMAELEKVRRVADRAPGEVTEVLLVLDATTGQNGLAQARQFTDSVGVTGIVLTKLDGSAKGGVVLAIRAELGVPIKLVGLGEGPDDLVVFDPEEFVGALLDIEG